MLDEKVSEPRQRVSPKDCKKCEPWIDRKQSYKDADCRRYRAKIVQSARARVGVALEIMKPKLREGGRPFRHAVR